MESGAQAKLRNHKGNGGILVEINGKILTQSYAIVRHFARQLGAYDGKTEDEKYWVDAMCDLASDCKQR